MLFDLILLMSIPPVRLGLEMKANASSWLSAKLILKAVQDGKVMDPANKKPSISFNLIYQNKNPYVDVNEAFLTSILERLISGWGFQKFAWGRLDELTPTDNMN